MYYNLKHFRQNSYNRDLAVTYATSYALTPNPEYRYFPSINNNSGDCSNFISQCLNAGGLPMNYNSKSMWWYNHGTLNTKDDTWSVSWAVANSLYWYLKTNTDKAIEITDLNYLELGDIIFYENYNNVIFHSAIITSFITINGLKEPLISQHTYNALNVTFRKSYAYKGVHFIKIINI